MILWKELENAVKWSKPTRIFCLILNYVNLSPGYLFVQRILRHNRVKRFTKLLNQQQSFTVNGIGLFKRDRNLVLKWTLTSDKSKIFLDLVDKDESSMNMLNWELPFP